MRFGHFNNTVSTLKLESLLCVGQLPVKVVLVGESLPFPLFRHISGVPVHHLYHFLSLLIPWASRTDMSKSERAKRLYRVLSAIPWVPSVSGSEFYAGLVRPVVTARQTHIRSNVDRIQLVIKTCPTGELRE